MFQPERAGVDNIRLADLLKIHLGVELDLQVQNSSHERETTSLCSHFFKHQSSKTRTDDQNQNILKFF